jgi:hypothetical protein
MWELNSVFSIDDRFSFPSNIHIDFRQQHYDLNK